LLPFPCPGPKLGSAAATPAPMISPAAASMATIVRFILIPPCHDVRALRSVSTGYLRRQGRALRGVPCLPLRPESPGLHQYCFTRAALLGCRSWFSAMAGADADSANTNAVATAAPNVLIFSWCWPAIGVVSSWAALVVPWSWQSCDSRCCHLDHQGQRCGRRHPRVLILPMPVSLSMSLESSNALSKLT
jgi:hypothetical protein